MPSISAGILLYRTRDGVIQVLLAHPGGPMWKNKDAGAWSIPKGKVDPGESLEDAARREFQEETGQTVAGQLIALSPVKLKSGKVVHAFASEGDCDPGRCVSNDARMEWPPRSGRLVTFPEIDKVAWFTLDEARTKLNAGQAPLIDELQRAVPKA